MSELPFIDDQPYRTARLAISQLFLDTDLDALDLKAIAGELAKTRLSGEELQRIYETEVAPACWRNLRALPGGAWGGFDEQSLMADIQRHRIKSATPTLWQRWQISRWTASTRGDWQRLLQVLQVLAV